MSFLDKLKSRVDKDGTKEVAPVQEVKLPTDFLQLDVDIYETSQEIIIFAPMPGATIDDLDISIEDENDVITIQGKKILPNVETGEKKQLLRQECHWGAFYRQIILPQEINVGEVDAHIKDGILVLRLPLLRVVEKGKKKIVVKS